MENQSLEISLPATTSAEITRAVNDDKALERFLFSQVSLNKEGQYFEQNCPLCNSQKRAEAEDKWLKSRNADEILEYLKSIGEPSPITVIKNHMEYHLDQAYQELRKREQINKTITLLKMPLDTLTRVELSLSAIMERLMSISSVEDSSISSSELEKLKDEQTCKLVTAQTKLIEIRANLMGEMKNDGDLLSVRKEDFSKIFAEILQEFKGEEARRIINRILEKFAASVKKQ